MNWIEIIQSLFIIVVCPSIIIYFWVRNFKVVNKKLYELFIIFLKKTFEVIIIIIRYGSLLSVFSVIFIICFAIFIPNNKQESLLNYLTNPKKFSYRERVLDKNDKMPKIKKVESADEIIEILSNRDFLEELLRGLTQNNYPCVYSYHVINNIGENETLPHFIILNKKFEVFNDFTKNTKPLLEFLNIEDSLIIKFIINKLGIDEIQGPFLFIFNANVTGGSMSANEQILKHSTLFTWNNSPDFLNRRLVIQITCVNVFWYKGEYVIEEALLTFTGKLAYCIQDFLLDVEKNNNNELV